VLVTQVEEGTNLVLTIYFSVEMLIKLTGLGWRGYLADNMNTFDGFVVIASILEVLLSSSGWHGASLSVFRAFRLMRVFKLARRWEELHKIVRTVFKSLASIAYLSLLLLLFIFMMALLGMQMFGHRYAA
jgi:voltage-dependent calcium channel L type alpha-1D